MYLVCAFPGGWYLRFFMMTIMIAFHPDRSYRLVYAKTTQNGGILGWDMF